MSAIADGQAKFGFSVLDLHFNGCGPGVAESIRESFPSNPVYFIADQGIERTAAAVHHDPKFGIAAAYSVRTLEKAFSRSLGLAVVDRSP